MDKQDVLIKERGLNGLYIYIGRCEGRAAMCLSAEGQGWTIIMKVFSELPIILCVFFVFVSVNAHWGIFVSKWITYSCIHELIVNESTGENAINSHLKLT